MKKQQVTSFAIVNVSLCCTVDAYPQYIFSYYAATVLTMFGIDKQKYIFLDSQH